MSALAVVVAAATVIALVYVKSYHRLVGDRDAVDDAWATLDAELRRRHELVPQLATAVEAGGVTEPRLLDDLVRTGRRAAGAGDHPAARAGPERELATAIAAVVALPEQYPQLDTQPRFAAARRELAASDDRVGAALWRYDVRADDLNRRRRGFPSGVIARRHGIDQAVQFGE